MRLGDLDALKEATKQFTDCDGFNPVWQIIDKAPTVETHDTVNWYCDKDTVINIQQIRPQGKWIKSNTDEGCYCPNCHHTGCDEGFMDNYCSNCGTHLAPPTGWSVSKEGGGLFRDETR